MSFKTTCRLQLENTAHIGASSDVNVFHNFILKSRQKDALMRKHILLSGHQTGLSHSSVSSYAERTEVGLLRLEFQLLDLFLTICRIKLRLLFQLFGGILQKPVNGQTFSEKTKIAILTWTQKGVARKCPLRRGKQKTTQSRYNWEQQKNYPNVNCRSKKGTVDELTNLTFFILFKCINAQ